ncbi:uncharacterized protein LOC123533201 [Mercenaria mercenaria]|uniref:uncharacterized protein LOC123533201 n=1 Tax=Mercenaria mercenaria TaxID=6596 RepID=UPI00234F302C|nr:uncharacterized protein LOC123533201 [Mercenaria mercenaria]
MPVSCEENGFPGSAYQFVDVIIKETEVDGCLNFPAGSEFYADCGPVEDWVIIDIRRAVLVSAIMVSSINRQRVEVYLKHIFVANERWSFLNDGALLCYHNEALFRGIDNIFACNR